MDLETVVLSAPEGKDGERVIRLPQVGGELARRARARLDHGMDYLFVYVDGGRDIKCRIVRDLAHEAALARMEAREEASMRLAFRRLT